MIELTEEQLQAVRASEVPVPVLDPRTKEAYVLLRAELYERIKALLEDAEDQREQEAWLDLTEEARREWAKENPY